LVGVQDLRSFQELALADHLDHPVHRRRGARSGASEAGSETGRKSVRDGENDGGSWRVRCPVEACRNRRKKDDSQGCKNKGFHAPQMPMKRDDKLILRALQRDASVSNRAGPQGEPECTGLPATRGHAEEARPHQGHRRIAKPARHLPGVREVRSFMGLKQVLSTTQFPV
jgi:hypothetical protein